MRQHILIIDNIDKDSQNSRANEQLKAREQILRKMQEQIEIRDNLLGLAHKHFTEHEVDVDLDDPKLVHLEEIVKINSSLPPISNNTGHFSIKNNLGINQSNLYGNQNSKIKPKNRFIGNSLPPVSDSSDLNDINSLNLNHKNFFVHKGYKNINPYGSSNNRKATNRNVMPYNSRVNRK